MILQNCVKPTSIDVVLVILMEVKITSDQQFLRKYNKIVMPCFRKD